MHRLQKELKVVTDEVKEATELTVKLVRKIELLQMEKAGILKRNMLLEELNNKLEIEKAELIERVRDLEKTLIKTITEKHRLEEEEALNSRCCK